MVTLEGARKLLELCPKATYHVDLDAWRHSSLELRMFHPMLAYQTFEDTSLTDVDKTHNKMSQFIVTSKAVQRLDSWCRDPHTLQPWSHVLAEPLIQIGPRGPVLTVERHCLVVGSGCVAAIVLEKAGMRTLSKIAGGATLTFFVTMDFDHSRASKFSPR
ncbi:hypothetical protein B484DRAFT_405706 [Ochromonadaceae sp. CCMP2298]|nr:hypothetical protein B484DRAFT_405706 [Ochromonadaceae sp. CCMP2298]